MQTLLDTLSARDWLRGFFGSPDTWWQIGIFLAGGLLAWLGGSWLQIRLQKLTQPGVVGEVRRTAMRTGLLALIPLILWLWLLAAATILRKQGVATDLLRPAMLLVGALAVIRAGVFVLRHSFSPGSWLKAWEGVLTVTIWSLVALHILGWLPLVEQALDEYAMTFGKVRISLYTVASFILSIALLMLVALWLTNAIRWRIRRSRVLDASMKIALSHLTKFTLLSVAVLAAMIAAGIDLTAFAVFGGALGVGLGLGLQRVVSNFVSGFILVFEGSIRPGDIINVGNTFGTVKALHARHIVVRTEDGLDIVVPNENLLTSEITNWSYDGDRKVRLRLPVQVSYGDDPEQAIVLLEEAARANARVLREPRPVASLTGFGDNGINLELRVWMEDLEYGVANVRSEINRRIWKDLRAAGISIPFPQRDVRLMAAPEAAPSPSGGKSGSRTESGRDQRRAPQEDSPD
jgi:small-conductance mechanosensitive channel